MRRDAVAWMIKYQKDVETNLQAITHGTMLLHYGYIQSSDVSKYISKFI